MRRDDLTQDLFSQCQRWKKGRCSYRPAGEIFDPGRCEVTIIGQAESKAFVIEHHYAHSFVASRLQVGIWHKSSAFAVEQLAGVAVFSVPMQERAIPAWFPGVWPREGVELGRFVLRDYLAANAESWTIGKSLRLLRKALPEVRAILSYCDPVERTDEQGRILKFGHIGTCYRAGGATYLGRSSARTLTLAQDGRCLSDRTLSKLRNDERGAGYAARLLLEMGAPARRAHEDGSTYVSRALREGAFRRIRHPGNYAFGWYLGPEKDSPLPQRDPARYPRETVHESKLPKR